MKVLILLTILFINIIASETIVYNESYTDVKYTLYTTGWQENVWTLTSSYRQGSVTTSRSVIANKIVYSEIGTINTYSPIRYPDYETFADPVKKEAWLDSYDSGNIRIIINSSRYGSQKYTYLFEVENISTVEEFSLDYDQRLKDAYDQAVQQKANDLLEAKNNNPDIDNHTINYDPEVTDFLFKEAVKDEAGNYDQESLDAIHDLMNSNEYDNYEDWKNSNDLGALDGVSSASPYKETGELDMSLSMDDLEGLKDDLGYVDNDIDNDGLLNDVDDDIDGDGELNINDVDDDGDGVHDTGDINDIDGDGLANGQDDDIDGDGVQNNNDASAWGDFTGSTNENTSNVDLSQNNTNLPQISSDPDIDFSSLENKQDETNDLLQGILTNTANTGQGTTAPDYTSILNDINTNNKNTTDEVKKIEPELKKQTSAQSKQYNLDSIHYSEMTDTNYSTVEDLTGLQDFIENTTNGIKDSLNFETNIMPNPDTPDCKLEIVFDWQGKEMDLSMDLCEYKIYLNIIGGFLQVAVHIVGISMYMGA
jgi:hypothetical protein